MSISPSLELCLTTTTFHHALQKLDVGSQSAGHRQVVQPRGCALWLVEWPEQEAPVRHHTHQASCPLREGNHEEVVSQSVLNPLLPAFLPESVSQSATIKDLLCACYPHCGEQETPLGARVCSLGWGVDATLGGASRGWRGRGQSC